MKVTLILDDRKYGTLAERGNLDDANFAYEIGTMVEKTVMRHLGHLEGFPTIEEEETES